MRILSGFRHVNRYTPREGVSKDAVFFVASAPEGAQAVPQWIEVSEIRWLSSKAAQSKLTYAADRTLCAAAFEFLAGVDGSRA